MSDATQLLHDLEGGQPAASEKLFPRVYDELRKLARDRLAKESPGQTLQATALVHEVYLRLSGEARHKPWAGRRQFFAVAAEAMRRILVENARRKNSLKRGGDHCRQTRDMEQIRTRRPDSEIIALHDALDALTEHDPLKAELVKLRYFVGLGVDEVADVLGISRSSVDRQWAYARAWLHRQISSS
jgi:RNA polymerase sigma factor (TIGR02999 family)